MKTKQYTRVVYCWDWRDIIHLAWYVRLKDWSISLSIDTWGTGFSFGPLWVSIFWTHIF